MYPVIKPTLVIDEVKCRNNIRSMADKALANNLIFRPHFKTHQSAKVGNWFRDYGVDRITVSSVDMAGYFTEHRRHSILQSFERFSGG